MTSLGRSFDAVPDLYDDVRPRYPDELYAAIDAAVGGIDGLEVLDLAAGTGIATRALLARGARVTALEPSESMLRRLYQRSPKVAAFVATAESLPLAADVVDLVTCATAWHWLDTARTVAEVRRVLHSGGHLAIWWANHRWADDVDWELAQGEVYARWKTDHGSRPSRENYSGVGPREAADDLRQRGLSVVVDREFFWTREQTLEQHLDTIATHSDVITLGDRKPAFIAELAEALEPWPIVTERLWGPLVVARF